MRLVILAIISTCAAMAADDVQLALTLKAQTDFDRVQLAAEPQLRETLACIQSQAALLPVASHSEMPVIHFRKGFCSLISGTVSHQPADFQSASAEFQASVQAWPARIDHPAKGVPVERVSAALPVLSAIAILETDPGKAEMDAAAKTIADALAAPSCPASVMPDSECRGILEIGRQWEGWIALRENRLDEAARDFSTGGWPEWVSGRQAFEQRNCKAAEERYRQAIHTWDQLGSQPAPGLAVRDRKSVV